MVLTGPSPPTFLADNEAVWAAFILEINASTPLTRIKELKVSIPNKLFLICLPAFANVSIEQFLEVLQREPRYLLPLSEDVVSDFRRREIQQGWFTDLCDGCACACSVGVSMYVWTGRVIDWIAECMHTWLGM